MHKFVKIILKENKDEMRLKNNFINIKEQGKKVLEADFICECGCRKFMLTHTGKNCLLRPSILNKKKGQLRIKAECRNCHRLTTVYDSTIEGKRPKEVKSESYDKLIKNNNDVFEIQLKYSFLEENYNTDKFTKISIKIKDDNETYNLYQG